MSIVKNEINVLTQYAKQGANDKLLDQEGIKNLISQLFSLELTGQNLKKVAQQLEDIQSSTRKGSSKPQKGKSSLGFLRSKKSPSFPTVSSQMPSSTSTAGGGTGGPSFQDMLAAAKKNKGLKGLLNKFM